MVGAKAITFVYSANMKTSTLLILTVMMTLSTPILASDKLLTCQRQIDFMFGDFQQGDQLYADIFISADKKLELDLVDETNQKVLNLSSTENTDSSIALSQSIISGSWIQNENPIELRLAYFGGVSWAGLIMFPKSIQASGRSFSAGSEIEIKCREIDFSSVQ